MNLLTRPAPKAPGYGDRTASLAEVLAKLPALRKRYGVTRIADTTHLDRIAIPTMSAFVPESADVLGVYSGKGRDRDEALVSTVMEAVERQIGVSFDPPTVSLLPRDLERHIDLAEVGYDGPEDRALRSVSGCNVLTGEPVFVPLGVVNPFADTENFSHWTTNGLATGSSPVEALYHALFEVVERHLWSEAEIRSSVWPRYLHARFGEALGLPIERGDRADDPAADEVVFPTGDPIVDEFASRIRAPGIAIRLFALSDEAWPIGMFACIREDGTDPPMIHSGMSCSWSPRRAAIAAMAEAVSSRVIWIQGAREDLIRAHAHRSGPFRHGKRLASPPSGCWFYDVPAPTVQFAELADRASDDLAVDIRRLLDVIRSFGLRCVAMVDLSPPDGSVHVVRVVAPGLERFNVDGSTTARTKRLLTRPFDF